MQEKVKQIFVQFYKDSTNLYVHYITTESNVLAATGEAWILNYILTEEKKGEKIISSQYIFIKYTNCSLGKKITAVEKYSIMQLNVSNTAQTIHSKNMWKHGYKK